MELRGRRVPMVFSLIVWFVLWEVIGRLELISLMGLAGVRGLGLEAERHPEQREEVLRVEEEGDAGDPVA